MTVEHLLSALSACEIDNVLIEVEGSEIPVGDGSARMFVDLIEQAGIVEQDAAKRYFTLSQPFSGRTMKSIYRSAEFRDRMSAILCIFRVSVLFRSQYFSLPVRPGAV